jgi:putative component of membrane protein insertase Oxa1/YidC/SpoIIIJ protein YidD
MLNRILIPTSLPLTLHIDASAERKPPVPDSGGDRSYVHAWKLTSRLLAVSLIKRYQTLVSPRITALNIRCVYEPSCSEYMILAIAKHGLIRGILAGVRRISRCRGGFDKVDYP